MAPRYFTDTAEQQQAREETIRNMRWALGEGEAAADTGMRGGTTTGVGRQQVDLRSDPQALSRLQPGLDFYRSTDVGVLRGNTGASDEMGYLWAAPGSSFRLISGGDLVGTASTPEEAMALVAQANAEGERRGRKANVVVQQAGADGNWSTIYHNAPNQTTLGKIADIGLPLALSLTPLGPVGGAALGSAASSVAQGRKLDETLLRAGISGLTALGVSAGLNALAPAAAGAAASAANAGGGAAASGLGGAVGGKAGSLASSVVSPGFNLLPGEVMMNVVAPSIGSLGGLANSIVSSGISSAAGSALGNSVASGPRTPVDGGISPELTVAAPPVPAPGAGGFPAFGGAMGGVLMPDLRPIAQNIAAQQDPPPAEGDDPLITVGSGPSGNSTLDALLAAGGITGGALAVAGMSDPTLAANAAQGLTSSTQGIGDVSPAAASAAGVPATTAAGGIPGLAAKVAGLTTAQKLALAGGLVGQLGGLVGAVAGGGGGGGSGGAGSIGTVNRNPIFSAALPEAGAMFRNPGGSAPAFTGDWNRYGMDYGQQAFGALRAAPPAQSTAPSLAAAAPGPVAAQALPAAQMLDGPAGYVPDTTRFAVGGSVDGTGARSSEPRYVRGEGSGRDDKIHALLSDNEYVIDAETVALLGDGSPDEGARRLDEFRANVRRHKGEKLARGKFSADAKPPEHYLRQGTR